MASKYWLGRYLAIKKAQLSKAKRYEDDYRKRMAETQKAIEAEMDSWIARYAKEDGTLDPLEAKKLLRGKDLKEWKYTLAEWEAMAKEGGYEKEMNLEYYKSRVSRLKELEGQLAIIMTKPTRKEMTAFEDMLTNTHKETYLKTIFTRQMQTSSISKAFNRLDPNTVQALVRNGWQGSNFSERIWQNSTQKLPKLLTESLFSGMVLGQSKDEIQQTLKHRLKGFTDNDIHRLVITESAYITEQATDLAYDETGVDKIEWIAALEIHTCDTPIEVDGKTYKGCRGLDGQVFTRSRKLLLPPAHPFCRCTTAPWDEILDEIEFSRWARDPETGESVDTTATTYKEWEKMVGVNGAEDAIGVKKADVKQIADKIKGDSWLKNQRETLIANRETIKAAFEERKEARREVTALREIYEEEESLEALDAYDVAVKSYNEKLEKYRELYNKKLEFENEYVRSNAKRVKEILSGYRQMGIGDLDLKDHFTNSRAQMSKVLTEAYDLYPTDWVKRSAAYGTITSKKRKRGYYLHGEPTEIALSDRSGVKNSLRTAIHELAHRQEYINADILKAEKEFYEYRTQGEQLVSLRRVTGISYDKSEVTRVDNFLDAYMGKEYSDGKAYELLTMGMDTLYADPLELTEDEEMFNWIIEMLITK